MGLYILHPNNVGRCGHICNASYAVKSQLRGHHIGEALVKHCMEQGKKLGFRILQFNAVVKSNASALHLYEKLGFTQLGVIPGGFLMKESLKKYRKHRKSEPLLQRWGPKTIGVGTQQREYSTIYSVCKCGFSIYRKKPHWKGWFYMVVRIITIIAAVTATGFFTLAALWFIGFLKVRQAWAWLFEDWDRRF